MSAEGYIQAQIDPQEDFRKWREEKEKDMKHERSSEHSYLVNAWAKAGYLADARAAFIGKVLEKLQRRIHRQRVANRELLLSLQAAERQAEEREKRYREALERIAGSGDNQLSFRIVAAAREALKGEVGR